MTPGPGDTRSNTRTWHKIIDELGGSSREYFAVRESGPVCGGGALGSGPGGVEKCWGSFRAVLRKAGTWLGGSRGGRRVAWSKSWSLAAPRSGRAVGGLGASVGREPGLGGAPGGGWGAGGGGAVGAAVVLAAGMFTFLEVAPALGYRHSAASSADLRPTGIPRGS